MEKREFSKYYIAVFLIILVYLSYIIIKPYIKAIITAAILAYLFYPIYKKIKSLIKNEVSSALFVTLIITLVILVPIAFIANALVRESITIINSDFIKSVYTSISNIINKEERINTLISEVISGTINYIKKSTSNFLFNLPQMIMSLVITAFSLFYFLIIGESLVLRIKEHLPIRKKEEIITHIGDCIYSIVHGSLVTALIMFVISLIGLKLVGINNPFILSLIIGISAFIPFVGPAVVWLPIAIIKYLNKEISNAIIIIILGLILSSIEMFAKPKIIGDKTKMHPIIVLIGIIGGMRIFGFIGLIIGPIILSTLIIIIKDYLPLKNET